MLLELRPHWSQVNTVNEINTQVVRLKRPDYQQYMQDHSSDALTRSVQPIAHHGRTGRGLRDERDVHNKG